MKRFALIAVVAALSAAPLQAADEAQPLTLVEAQPFSASSVNATGRVQPIAMARVGARVSGRIADFGKNADGAMLDAGMTVKTGDVLFRLDETTFKNAVASAEAALASAQANLANLIAKTRDERLEQLRQAVAELDVRLADRQREEQRFRRLVEEDKTLPAKRLEEVQTELAVLGVQRKLAAARLLESENGPTKTEIAIAEATVHQADVALNTAKDDQRDSTVKAPFDALITRRFKSPGDYVTGAPNTEVIELISADRLEVELRLPEAYFALVEPGKTTVILNSSLLKTELKLPVARVVASIDAATGTFVVKVAIPADRPAGVVPGVFVNARIAVDSQAQGVLAPLRAIVTRDGKSAVFVARAGKMVRLPVEVGDRLTESAVIRSGLAAGEKIVIGPAEALKDGAALPEYLIKGK